MIIADTSVWIEYLKGNEEVGSMFTPYLRKNHIIAISAVFGELLQGVKNKRERKVIAGFWENVPKLNEEGLFIEAGNLSNKYKLYSKGIGLIDSYILAVALKYNFALWTFDKRLLEASEMLSD